SNPPSSSSMASSTRRSTTRACSSPSSRITPARNETRFLRDSTRTSWTSFKTILSGTPGRPAPEPRSSSVRSGAGSPATNSALSRGTVHQPLLGDLQNIGHRPVQDEPRRQIQEHEREDERHDEHHLRLAGIAGGRRHLLLDEHREAHQER